ncbi:6-phosphofructokinase [Auriscalpium vulgare]|uniref:6-phosphofructokinase n=1 Tax=Auriscalpium vulgare TaxID=40419 RepID=A0ACB8RZY1_9AGAM|nr:6-phosphofructokinase [Auriscalpium vulgare]
MKIAVLTSGGDSAGMNAVVRAVVKAGILKGCETWIVREGYEGLVRGNADAEPTETPSLKPAVDVKVREPSFIQNLRFGDGELLRDGTGDHTGGRTLKGRYIIRVGWDDVRGWFAECECALSRPVQGGTLIGTARSAAFRTQEGRLKAAYNLIKEGIDALAVCGGDGSLTGADVFRAEWPQLLQTLHANGQITDEQLQKHGHLRIVGLVGSIDNDMSMTDLTIGAPTALHRICEAIDNIHSTANSHSRAFVLEVMGRHCGWLALLAGVSSGADFVFIPERPPQADPWEDMMCDAIKRHREIGKRKTIVIVAEGAHDSQLKPIQASYVKDVLADRLGLDTRVTTLGHIQRGGRPCAWDRILPTLQGLEAVDALLEATPDKPSYMIGMRENRVTRVPLMEAVAMTQSVTAAIKAKDFEKAMSLRDPEFQESLKGFFATSTLETEMLLPPAKRIRVAIMHMGAPAGGMNAATRAAVRYCLRQGHTPLAISNGFRGLLDDNIYELSWLGVDNWMVRGGSELGTNRQLPDVDLGAVAAKFQEYGIQALLVIGGFEAFNSLVILEEGRKYYPAFHIPMVHIPATISNNVPMTELSLGTDTSMNALVDACDAIKQSASASRNRVFVVETQGGMCGYIAVMGALAVGASIVYTPEAGIDLNMLRADVKFLKARYGLDVKGKSEGRIVIRSEKSSSIYTTDVITQVYKEEGGALFDARGASLGHTLQGGVPSPLDRAAAVRFSLKSMAFIEQQHEILMKQPAKTRTAAPDSAAVITIQSSSIQWVPVKEMVAHADMKLRRGKHTWWQDMKGLVETLVARTQPHLPSVSASTIPAVKFQEIIREGQSTIVARMKVPTPSGHAFILRRLDTGAISLTTMFRAAFPTASEESEREEAAWVKANYDLSGTNKAGKARFAGTWVGPGVAQEIADAYSLTPILEPLTSAEPDPNMEYRKSSRAQQQTPDKPASAVKQLPTPSPSMTTPNPPKRSRREASPAPRVGSTSPAKPPSTASALPIRRSARTASPAPTSLPKLIATPIKPVSPKITRSQKRRVEVATPAGSDETAVDDEIAEIQGPDMSADIAEQKEMIAAFKAQREAALNEHESEDVGMSTDGEQDKKRDREEEDAPLQFDFKEPGAETTLERQIATNRRIRFPEMTTQRKSLAWGVALFAAAAGAVTYLPNPWF